MKTKCPPLLKTDSSTSYYLFFLNLISFSAVLWVNSRIPAFVCVPLVAASTAWIESWIFTRLKGHGKRPAAAARIWLWLIAIIQNILLVTDIFLLIQFDTIISQQTIDLIFGTNPSEAIEFLGSYVNPWLLTGGIILLVALNLLLYKGAARLAHATAGNAAIKWVRRILTAGGFCVWGYMVVMFALYRHGAEIPTYTTPTRVLYGCFQRHQNIRKMQQLTALCRNATATQQVAPDFDIIFILGESFNRTHTPLYGYNLPTTPGLSALHADSSLIVMTDVVTHEDWTQKVLMSIFSPGRNNTTFGQTPVFPVLLRNAGWYTALYDNEFLVTHDTFFFNNAELSEMMFDFRNEAKTRYDGELASQMTFRPGPGGFYMLHLIGQHFTYADRYPTSYTHFKPSDYDGTTLTSEQKEIMAHYDNATLYNDAVVNSVIKRIADRNAIVIYFTDHGEEIYDCRDYFGHGNAISASDIEPQIHIPFMVYATEGFRNSHPDTWDALRHAANLPVTTDDFPHLILDLAGVETPHFDPTRSFINPAYDATRHRTVLHSVDYDANRH